MRLFFAIPIPPEYKTKLLAAFARDNHPNIRFTLPEQLHITVHFLGNVDKEKLPAIIQQAGTITAVCKAFDIKFETLKLIQRQRKPVMIWAQMQVSESFGTLSMQFRNAFPTEEKKEPNPHITIARIKQLKHLPFELPHVRPFSFKAERINLYESIMHPAGAIYRLKEEWALMK